MQKLNTLEALAVCGLMTLLGACGPSKPPDGEPIGGPRCGGFAGEACPGAGMCVDDPRDSCDPEEGGADCIGICECKSLGLCIEGMQWDDSPHVCSCVPVAYDPCIATLCPVGTFCENQGGEGVCLAPDGGAAGELCGESQCGPGQVCCNASCGICTAPDGVCIQIACD